MFDRTNRTRETEEIQLEAAKVLRAERLSQVSCTNMSSVSIWGRDGCLLRVGCSRETSPWPAWRRRGRGLALLWGRSDSVHDEKWKVLVEKRHLLWKEASLSEAATATPSNISTLWICVSGDVKGRGYSSRYWHTVCCAGLRTSEEETQWVWIELTASLAIPLESVDAKDSQRQLSLERGLENSTECLFFLFLALPGKQAGRNYINLLWVMISAAAIVTHICATALNLNDGVSCP